jgi:hypothetical protein
MKILFNVVTFLKNYNSISLSVIAGIIRLTSLFSLKWGQYNTNGRTDGDSFALEEM